MSSILNGTDQKALDSFLRESPTKWKPVKQVTEVDALKTAVQLEGEAGETRYLVIVNPDKPFSKVEYLLADICHTGQTFGCFDDPPYKYSSFLTQRYLILMSELQFFGMDRLTKLKNERDEDRDPHDDDVMELKQVQDAYDSFVRDRSYVFRIEGMIKINSQNCLFRLTREFRTPEGEREEKHCVLKVITAFGEEANAWRRQAYYEIALMRQCRMNDCDTSYFNDVYEYEVNGSGNPYYDGRFIYFILMPEFEDYGVNSRTGLSEKGLFDIAESVLKTLQFMHNAHDYRPVYDELKDRFLRFYNPLTGILNAEQGLSFIHCDIKPSNLLKTEEGRVLLADFGSVGRRNYAPGGSTAPYCPPETYLLSYVAKPSFDIYSLGMTLYDMALPGRVEDNLRKNETPTNISPEFYEIIQKMMQEDEAYRYTSTLEVLVDLDRIRSKVNRAEFEDSDLIRLKITIGAGRVVDAFKMARRLYDADRNNPVTARVYAWLLASNSEPGSVEDAMSILKRLIEENNDPASKLVYALLGLILLSGQKPSADDPQAMARYLETKTRYGDLIRESAQDGFVLAKYYCGMYGIKKRDWFVFDKSQALKYMTECAFEDNLGLANKYIYEHLLVTPGQMGFNRFYLSYNEAERKQMFEKAKSYFDNNRDWNGEIEILEYLL